MPRREDAAPLRRPAKELGTMAGRQPERKRRRGGRGSDGSSGSAAPNEGGTVRA
jgi:hypothetical protein